MPARHATARSRKHDPVGEFAQGLAILFTSSMLALFVLAAPLLGEPHVTLPMATPAERCRHDLLVERDRWKRDPSFEINPKSCDQPKVTYEQYVEIWNEVGGWTTTYIETVPAPATTPKVLP